MRWATEIRHFQPNTNYWGAPCGRPTTYSATSARRCKRVNDRLRTRLVALPIRFVAREARFADPIDGFPRASPIRSAPNGAKQNKSLATRCGNGGAGGHRAAGHRGAGANAIEGREGASGGRGLAAAPPPVCFGGKWGFPGWGQEASGTRPMPPAAPVSGTLGNIDDHTRRVPDSDRRAFVRPRLVSDSLPRRAGVKNPDRPARAVGLVRAGCGRGAEASPRRSSSSSFRSVQQAFSLLTTSVVVLQTQAEGGVPSWLNAQANPRCRS